MRSTEIRRGRNNPGEVRAKKHLGQHFLHDVSVAERIVEALVSVYPSGNLLEVGPGMGVLTKRLLTYPHLTTHAVELDKESVVWLNTHFPQLSGRLTEGDFLRIPLSGLAGIPVALIGNFPYNISSQIVFKVLENRTHIPWMVGMFQKEVAERIGASPGNKSYGILSVLTQAYYEVEYLFTVGEEAFDPPPQVKSGVIRMKRRALDFEVEEKQLFRVVKTAFNQRRKKLRNALSEFDLDHTLPEPERFIGKRAEELSVEEFVLLTNLIFSNGKGNH